MSILAKEEGYEKASDSQLAYIESLIHNCELDEIMKTHIEDDLMILSYEEAENIIQFLKLNQRQTLNQQLDQALRRD